MRPTPTREKQLQEMQDLEHQKQLNGNYFEKLKEQDQKHKDQITLYEIQLLTAMSRLTPDQKLRNLLIGIATEKNINMEILKLVIIKLIEKDYITLETTEDKENPDFTLTESGKALVKRINKKGESA